MTTDRRTSLTIAAVLVALVAGTAACAPTPRHSQLDVWVALPPLRYLVERIAGDRATITDLTPRGADPHGVELSPSQVAGIDDADLLVYVAGLQPATDSALTQIAPDAVVDTLDSALTPLAGVPDPPEPSRDPHFWLDPIRFGLAAEQVTDALIALDPDHAEQYTARAAALATDLTALDDDLQHALDPCAGATLVTSHEAFGYLAARYGLEQRGIRGIDPEVEPSPARVREIATVVQETGVRTIFVEQATDPDVAAQLAEDLGVTTAVLDPLERPSDPDYLVVMRANLEALTAGLVCD